MPGYHSSPQGLRSFWSAPRIATFRKVQFSEQAPRNCLVYSQPIRFVRLDSEPAQSGGKFENRRLPLLDIYRGLRFLQPAITPFLPVFICSLCHFIRGWLIWPHAELFCSTLGHFMLSYSTLPCINCYHALPFSCNAIQFDITPAKLL